MWKRLLKLSFGAPLRSTILVFLIVSFLASSKYIENLVVEQSLSAKCVSLKNSYVNNRCINFHAVHLELPRLQGKLFSCVEAGSSVCAGLHTASSSVSLELCRTKKITKVDLVIGIPVHPKSINNLQNLVLKWLREAQFNVDVVLFDEVRLGHGSEEIQSFVKAVNSSSIKYELYREPKIGKSYGKPHYGKSIALWELLKVNYPEKKFYLKIDDDVSLRFSLMMDFLQGISSIIQEDEPVYFGSVEGTCADRAVCYAQGSVYGMNRAAFDLLTDSTGINCLSVEGKRLFKLKRAHEDLLTGLCLKKRGVIPLHCGNFYALDFRDENKVRPQWLQYLPLPVTSDWISIHKPHVNSS